MDGSQESENESERGQERRPSVTVEKVVSAIKGLKENKGCTITAVKKYIASNSSEPIQPKMLTSQLRRAIRKGLKEGQITKIGGYKYALDINDDDGSKKRRRRRRPDDDDLRPQRRRRRSRRRKGGRRRRGRSRRRRRSRRRGGRRRRSRRGGRRRRSRRRRRRSRRRRRR